MNNDIIESIQGTKIILADDDGRKKQFDIAGIFSIDDANLAGEFSKQSSLFAYFAVLAAKAERNSSIADMAADREYAVADQEIRSELSKQDIKPTEPMVKQMITADGNYCDLQDVAQAAKYEFKLLKAITQALEMRANMLISLGAYMRHEMEMTDMNVRRRSYDSSVEDTKAALRDAKLRRQNRD